MNVSKKLSVAIKSAINAGATLNHSLATELANTTSAQRDAVLWECAAIVAEAYTDLGNTLVQAYASRKGQGITFGTRMDDGSFTRTPESNAARMWFDRNIKNAGFLSYKKNTPAKSKSERLAATFKKLTPREQREFLALIA